MGCWMASCGDVMMCAINQSYVSGSKLQSSGPTALYILYVSESDTVSLVHGSLS